MGKKLPHYLPKWAVSLLHSHQQWESLLLCSLASGWHWYCQLSVLFILSILIGLQWCFIVLWLDVLEVWTLRVVHTEPPAAHRLQFRFAYRWRRLPPQLPHGTLLCGSPSASLILMAEIFPVYSPLLRFQGKFILKFSLASYSLLG